MRARDMALAALTSVIWGLGFVAIKFALESFTAPELTAFRFLIACLPIIVVARPRISGAYIFLIGLTLFTGQFLLLFWAFSEGMPAGLASVTQQMQAFFTVLLAAVFLHDIPSRRQWAGMSVAFLGLTLIGLTMGRDLNPTSMGLAIAAAFSWAVGNLLVKRATNVPIFSLVVWSSLVPPLPALLLSIAHDGRLPLLHAVRYASWLSIGAAIYLGLVATVFAYAIWGHLLRRHSVVSVAPFALIAPCVGIISSAILLGEVFGPARYVGMALILTGLTMIVIPRRAAGCSDAERHRPTSSRA